MIERYVFIKLSEQESSDEGRRELAERARRLFPTMDGVEHCQVAVKSEAAGQSPWDLVLSIGFADKDAATRYMRCPIHAEWDAELAMLLDSIEAMSMELL